MPAVQIYSDFDGTICQKDTGNILIDTCMGYESRMALDEKILSNELTFREATTQCWESINMTYEEAWKLVREAELDSGFRNFYAYVNEQQIPFTIVSCGLDIVIKEYLSWHLGEDKIRHLEIQANYAHVNGRQWRVTYRDDSHFTHDKSRCLREARRKFQEESETNKDSQAPILVFCGDGISDLSAAREADVMFARRGLELEAYCRKHHVPFLPFDSFAEIQAIVQDLHEGSVSLPEILKRQQDECERLSA